MTGRDPLLVLGDRLEAKFRELQRIPMPTSEFWKGLAQVAIDEVDRIRGTERVVVGPGPYDGSIP